MLLNLDLLLLCTPFIENFNFVHIKGHSNNLFNTIAHNEAKYASDYCCGFSPLEETINHPLINKNRSITTIMASLMNNKAFENLHISSEPNYTDKKPLQNLLYTIDDEFNAFLDAEWTTN